MKKFTFILVFLTALNLISAQSYELDKSFGSGGVIKILREESFYIGYKIVPLNDGYFYTYASIEDFESEEILVEIRKFDKNGKSDTNFGNEGVFLINANFLDSPPDFCLLPDNSIIFQDVENVEVEPKVKLSILSSEGKVTKSFELDIFNNEIAIISKWLYKDNFLYMGGNFSSHDSLFVIKTDLYGKIDSTFADNGVFKEKNLPQNMSFEDLDLQDNNLVVKSAYYDNDTYKQFNYLIRINSDGKLDTLFGNQGVCEIPDPEGYDLIGFVTIDSKNRIIFSGFYNPIIYRFTKDGIPDNTFGKNGLVNLIELNVIGNFFFSNVSKDDKIILYGSISTDDETFGVPIILKLDESGKRDTEFGVSGIVFNYLENLAVNVNGSIDDNGTLTTIGASALYNDFKSKIGNRVNSKSEGYSMFLTRLKPVISSEKIVAMSSELIISPNPLQLNQLNFEFPSNIEGKVSIDIIDLLGKSVFKTEISDMGNGNNEVSMDFPNYIKNGQYLVIVNNSKEIMTKKIVVNR